MTNPSLALAECLRAIVESPTCRLAYEDTEPLGQDDLRPLRLQLELLKPERILRKQGVYSNVVVFGSARVTDEVAARARLAALEHGGAAVVDFEYLVDEGYIAPMDVDLFTCIDDAEEIIAALEHFYAGRMPEGVSP